MSWTDARRPVPRLWIRSAEVRGGGEGETSLGEWEHNNILRAFIFQIILIFDFFFFQTLFSLCCLSKDINTPTAFINIFTKLLVFESNIKRNVKDVLCYTISLKLHYS